MIKTIALGIWISGVTLLATYGTLMMNEPTPGPAKRSLGGIDYVKLSPIAVPVVHKRGVAGYVIARVTITADELKVKKLGMALHAYATAAAFKTIYDDPSYAYGTMERRDLKAVAKDITASANDAIGEKVIESVIIEGMTFLNQSQVRCDPSKRA
ncbi:MAG: hypothetical protein AAF732_07125 [Pseudomonadota bacterium]